MRPASEHWLFRCSMEEGVHPHRLLQPLLNLEQLSWHRLTTAHLQGYTYMCTADTRNVQKSTPLYWHVYRYSCAMIPYTLGRDRENKTPKSLNQVLRDVCKHVAPTRKCIRPYCHPIHPPKSFSYPLQTEGVLTLHLCWEGHRSVSCHSIIYLHANIDNIIEDRLCMSPVALTDSDVKSPHNSAHTINETWDIKTTTANAQYPETVYE